MVVVYQPPEPHNVERYDYAGLPLIRVTLREKRIAYELFSWTIFQRARMWGGRGEGAVSEGECNV